MSLATPGHALYSPDWMRVAVAGTHVNIKKYVEAPNESFEERLNVFESGKPGEDEKCVGYVRLHCPPPGSHTSCCCHRKC